jgi:hypothetical protein
VDKTYLTFVTNFSTDPRHGKHVPVSTDSVKEVRLRAWTIMNRFLHYRMSGNQQLPQVWFPMLFG